MLCIFRRRRRSRPHGFLFLLVSLPHQLFATLVTQDHFDQGTFHFSVFLICKRKLEGFQRGRGSTVWFMIWRGMMPTARISARSLAGAREHLPFCTPSKRKLNGAFGHEDGTAMYNEMKHSHSLSCSASDRTTRTRERDWSNISSLTARSSPDFPRHLHAGTCVKLSRSRIQSLSRAVRNQKLCDGCTKSLVVNEYVRSWCRRK